MSSKVKQAQSRMLTKVKWAPSIIVLVKAGDDDTFPPSQDLQESGKRYSGSKQNYRGILSLGLKAGWLSAKLTVILFCFKIPRCSTIFWAVHWCELYTEYIEICKKLFANMEMWNRYQILIQQWPHVLLGIINCLMWIWTGQPLTP